MAHPATNLIQRILSGDPASFEDVIAWYSSDILRLGMLLLRDEEEAKDILQESMIRLIQQIRSRKIRSENGSIKGFLLTVARNLCLDRLRKRNRLRPVEESEEPGFQDTYTPDRFADENQFQEAFELAIQQLTDIQRTILVLHDHLGESNRKIAETLSITTNSVTTHLCRARRKLRRLLAPYGEDK